MCDDDDDDGGGGDGDFCDVVCDAVLCRHNRVCVIHSQNYARTHADISSSTVGR